MKPRCPTCKKLMTAMAADAEIYRCVRCDAVDPMQTVAARWANSSLATPMRTGSDDQKSAK
jgi:ribosomal protein L37AE/L43A